MSRNIQDWRCWCSWLVVGAVLIASLPERAFAQITQDNTLPNNSSVTRNGNTFNITGGTQAGSNLFHSFSEFSVPTGGTAFFNNAVDIQNIVSRVTGKSVSNINGLIKTNGTANLFLINPNGIIFGSDASLDVRGSFVATTANAIQFGNQGFFSASAPNVSPLLNVNPSAFLFNQIAAQPIRNQSLSGLTVPIGRSLVLLGGDVKLEESIFDIGGFIYAPGGRVELGGLAGAGTVGLNVEGNHLRLSFPDNVARANVSLTDGAIVDVTGGGGSIVINSQNLNMTGGSLLQAGIYPPGLGFQAGNIEINAIGAINLTNGSLISNEIPPETVGKAGNINITTGSLSVTNGARLNASTSGQGDAGSVNINARDVVSFDGVDSNGLPSSALSNVEEEAIGNAGGINIKAGSLFVTNGARVESLTRRQGNAGSVNINARDVVSFDGVGNNNVWLSGAYSTVEAGAKGEGGSINITTGSLSVTNGAFLNSSTFGTGDAGSVTIQADGSVTFGGVGSTGESSFVASSVESGGIGNGGSINIKAGSLTLTDGANIQTLVRGTSYDNKLSSGRGNAGNVSIDVRDAVTIAGINKNIGYFGGILSSVSAGAMGNSGSINIKAGSFSLTDGGTLSADTLGQGKGGNINLNVKGAILLTGGSTAPDSKESTRITLGVIPGAIGSGGDLYIKASSLVMIDGAIVKDSTQGQGNAGNIYVDADVVDISGSVPSNGLPSGLFTSTTTNGRAGDIIINTQTFQIADGAALSARSKGNGQAGEIRVNASSFEATNGGQLVTTTFGKGQAGNILINATDRVSISGSDPNYSNRIAKFPSPINPNVANDITETGATSGLFANTEPNSTAQGGGIKITTGQLLVQNRAEVSVNSAGLGNAGSLIVEAGSIGLDNGAKISADTSGGGGNIDLRSSLLLLHHSSSVTTKAQGSYIPGGNITIDANNGFIIAVPSENSDISADSTDFRGGNVSIKNAAGIFGIQSRKEPSPQTSDITATGASPELSGKVKINTLGIDPNIGLVNLPTIPVDTKVAQSCYSPGYAQSSFVITGRGGLPPNPKDILTPDAPQIDWVAVKPSNNNRSLPPVTIKLTISTPETIVEATGATLNAKGEIVLIANSFTVTTHPSRQNPIQCHGS